jgi:hypothetical protein
MIHATQLFILAAHIDCLSALRGLADAARSQFRPRLIFLPAQTFISFIIALQVQLSQ